MRLTRRACSSSRQLLRRCTRLRRRSTQTDWAGVVRLYDVMLRREPSALVALNRAIAIGQLDGSGRRPPCARRHSARRRPRRRPRRLRLLPQRPSRGPGRPRPTRRESATRTAGPSHCRPTPASAGSCNDAPTCCGEPVTNRRGRVRRAPGALEWHLRRSHRRRRPGAWVIEASERTEAVVSATAAEDPDTSARARTLPLVSMLISVVLAGLLPFLGDRRFYLADDNVVSWMPTSRRIGELLRSGESHLMDPEMWWAGNFVSSALLWHLESVDPRAGRHRPPTRGLRTRHADRDAGLPRDTRLGDVPPGARVRR